MSDGGKKNNKPKMEKRRRARMNASLGELKALLLDSMKRDGTKHNKMEKADILEYTVQYLRRIQRQEFSVAAASDPSILNKYYAGYNECTEEVSKFLLSADIDSDLRTRLVEHLTSCSTIRKADPNNNNVLPMTFVLPERSNYLVITNSTPEKAILMQLPLEKKRSGSPCSSDCSPPKCSKSEDHWRPWQKNIM
ncbi:DgyrCDS15 [Dimorphilus gyrociliatus]|uniref:DgyrCDS15 n=1 Tax=Dimorphilus gyrociliatus TaxID=2664684 RepID=A0A7I8V3C8_9ANNE|nr:DgyrCDS15 [Dimorphilus gyrociliatus]